MIKKYKIERNRWEDPPIEVKITGLENEGAVDKVIQALENAEVVFDRVFVEVERVYECIYDCMFGRLAAA
jgi:hypothetical protein